MPPFPSAQSYIVRSARRGGVVAWAIAIAALVVAVALRMALEPYLVDSVSFVTLFGAVAIAVWMLGPRFAVGFAFVGYLACHYLFVEPRDGLFFDDVRTVVGTLAYAVTCWLIIAIGEATRSAEDFAQARGELLRVTLASIGDAVIATDVEARITYLNESAEMLTGWSCMEALGYPLNTVFRLIDSDDEHSIVAAAMRAPRAGRPVENSQRAVLLGRDTVARLIEHSAAPIKGADGLIAGCVVTFRDIAEKHWFERQETERMRTSRLLAAIVESSDDAIISDSLDGVVRTWNAAAERMFGYAAGEMVGQPIAKIIPADRCAQEEALFLATLKAGQRVEQFATERVHKNGRRVVVSLNVSAITDAAGSVIGSAQIVHDMSRQSAFAQRERELLHEAAAANERLRAFFDRCAVFVAIMLPSGTVLEPSRLSWEGCGYRREQIAGKPLWEGPWWARSPILVARIKQACEHAARGDALRAEIPYFFQDGTERLAEVSIAGIKDAEGRMLLLAATAIDITERRRAEDDRQRLAVLIENSTDLIGMYGLDFMPIELNPAGLALVGLETIEDARRHHVQDFFLPEDRQRMMGEFFATVMREGQGATQIRLRNLRSGEVRWMDYKVLTLRDTLGRRTGYATIGREINERRALDVGLPKPTPNRPEADHHERAADDRRERGAAQGEAQLAASAHKPLRRILVVDDNRDAATRLAMLLQLDGHPTFIAHDGAEALDAAERHRPDVVLLDIGMPVLSGYEVCRRLRERPYGKQIFILALTGWGQESDRRRTREAGFDGHFVKPANYGALAAALGSGRRKTDNRGCG